MRGAATPITPAQKQAQAAQFQIGVLTLNGEEFKLALNAIPLRDKSMVRRQTGMPFEQLWADGDQIGEDSLAVVWWLARRADGEPNLSWGEVLEQWPSPVTPETCQFVIETPDEEDEHPEASGPDSSTSGPPSPTGSD